MKKIFLPIILLIALFTGCTKKTDELFDKPADERITETLNGFQTALTAAPGWKLFVYPQGLANQDIEVGGLTYYVQFNNNNRVKMVADFTVDMANEPKESSYRLKAAQRPSIIFDTYSYIHTAADPDPEVSFSPTNEGGYGWGSDFDFSFVETTPKDTIKLKGNFNNSDALLIKATAAEMDAAFNKQLGHIVEETIDYSTSNANLYFNGNDNTKISLSFNLFLYIINFNYVTAGGEIVSTSAPFSHTTYGLHLKEPITVGGYTFQDMYWDDVLKVYYLQVEGKRVNIQTSAVPLLPLDKAIGKTISTISIPPDALPGQSPLFTTRYNTVKTNLKTGGYNLDLGIMDFIFDDASKTMGLLVYVQQNGVPFVLQYIYNYQLSNDGVVKFTRIGSNGNGNLVLTSMRPILNFIDNDQFKLDYFVNTTPVLGLLTSLENPDFYFTGNLR